MTQDRSDSLIVSACSEFLVSARSNFTIGKIMTRRKFVKCAKVSATKALQTINSFVSALLSLIPSSAMYSDTSIWITTETTKRIGVAIKRNFKYLRENNPTTNPDAKTRGSVEIAAEVPIIAPILPLLVKIPYPTIAANKPNRIMCGVIRFMREV